MRCRIFQCWVVRAFIAAFLFAGCATAESADAPPRIIAIGDLHGDYEAYEALLKNAGLIDNRGRWAGGETVLVQTGDIPDRGPDSLKIIEHLRELQNKAPRKGGKVVTLVGNHEAMNVTGDLRYVHAGEYEAFANRGSRQRREATYNANRETLEAFYLKQDSSLSSNEIREKWFEATPLGKLEHQTAWRPDGDIGEWIANNPAVAIVGDSLFVHGGISADYVAFSIDDINTMVREALIARNTAPTSILYDADGPLWYRGHVHSEPTLPQEEALQTTETITAPAPSASDEIDLALNAFGVQRIVIGHTPSLTGIKASYGGKVIQIDTGIANYYGGTQSYLEIRDGALIAHDNGTATVITAEPAEE